MYGPVYSMISAAGKFKETKSVTIIAAITNVLLSSLLVKKYQISGVLFATVFSELFIIMPYYVKCIYKDVLDENKISFYKKFFYSLLIVICLVQIDKLLIKILSLYSVASYLNWFISSTILGIMNVIIIFLALYFTMKSFKALILRLKKEVKKWKLVLSARYITKKNI